QQHQQRDPEPARSPRAGHRRRRRLGSARRPGRTRRCGGGRSGHQRVQYAVHDWRMATAQGGIFALGTASHAYLEFDAVRRDVARQMIAAVASLREPRTTMGGVNLVAGFRPELWRDAMPGDAPANLEGFNQDLAGVDGFVMPASQHDAVMWISGSAYDVVFDMAREVIAELSELATVAVETSSWPYRHDRDLTGF